MRLFNLGTVAVLEHLIADVDFDKPKKIENSTAFMAVHVEKVGEDLFSIAHYFEQNGDLMSDPEMVFWRQGDNRWWPVSITQHAVGVYREALRFDASVPRVNPRLVSELCEFANLWMGNIRDQQRLEIGARGVARTLESSLGCEAPA